MRIFKNIILLAAGQSRRFYPLGDKNLFEFFDRPVLSHRIQSLSPYADFVTVVANEENFNAVREIVSDFKNVKIVIQKKQGFANAIKTCKGIVSGSCLITGAVDLCDQKMHIEKIKKNISEKKIILTFFKTDKYFPGGYGKFENGKLTGIIEKPGAQNTPSNRVKYVFDYFPDIEYLYGQLEKEDTEAEGFYEKILSEFIMQDRVLYLDLQGRHTALKYPFNVLDADLFFLHTKLPKGQGKNVKVSKHAIIQGEVYMGDNVVVHEYAKITGPCYIGQNTVVGNYAMVIASHIGKNCLIGGYSEVTRSHLGSSVLLHRNFIGDSVLSDNVLVAAGTVLANWRFDRGSVKVRVRGSKIDSNREKFGAVVGRDVKIGINCSLMPGVKVTPGVIVAPCSCVDKDVD